MSKERDFDGFFSSRGRGQIDGCGDKIMNCVSNDDSSVPEGSPGSATMSHSGSLDDSQPVALANDQNKLIHLDPIPDFQDKAEIKPWLQKIYYPQGIEIVIERSDRLKVVFKCKASKRGKNSQGWTPQSESPVSLTKQSSPEGCKKKRSVSRFNLCPFRIRATFSLKRKKWNIVVVNNSHSHPLRFDPSSDDYKKFKEKLRQDNDWEAIKKFDELEYRSKSNLPIESSVITCDCGLTNEISSFDIVLPSAKPSTMINKPKSNSKLRQQRKESLRKIPQQHDFLPNTTHVDSHAVSGFIDDLSLSQPFAPLPTATDAFTDLNEIDFTNIFHKPHHTSHQHERHSITETPIALNVFSPPTNSTFQYYSPTDELLNSPAQQRPPSVSTHHSANPLDIGDKQRWNLYYNDQSQDSLGTPLCEISNSDVCRADTDTPQRAIGDVLSHELNAIKALDGDLQIIDESLSTQAFPGPGFQGDSPWTAHESSSYHTAHDNHDDATEKSFWDMNFESQP